MKNSRSTIAILLIGALLGAYIYFFERGPVKKDDDKKVKVFPKYVADDISQIQVENFATSINANKVIDMHKDDKGAWQIDVPMKIAADETTLRSVLNGVGDFNPEATIENPTKLADYGLNSPNARCTLKNKAGESFAVMVGDKSVGGNSYYVLTGGKSTVYLLPSYSIDYLKKPFNEYRDRSFIKTDTFMSHKVRVTRNGKTLMLEKGTDNTWKILEPIQDKAEESKVRDLLSNINNLRVDNFVEDNPAGLAKYGLSNPYARIEVWNNGEKDPHSILLGNKKKKDNSIYAKKGDSPSVVLVRDFIDNNINFKPSEYRDKSVMRFELQSARTLTVQHNGKTYKYTKDDKGTWASPGRPNALSEANDLINDLSQTTISSFAEKSASTGLASPTYVVEVGLPDNKVRTYRYGNREKDQVYLASDKTKDVYLVSPSAVDKMEIYFSTILTPVPSAPTPSSK
ncbi:MAG TPA: DUF4340 domain-containing protein [bacterium]|nr:DUF4340 domain-containing protein [bacterium]